MTHFEPSRHNLSGMQCPYQQIKKLAQCPHADITAEMPPANLSHFEIAHFRRVQIELEYLKKFWRGRSESCLSEIASVKIRENTEKAWCDFAKDSNPQKPISIRHGVAKFSSMIISELRNHLFMLDALEKLEALNKEFIRSNRAAFIRYFDVLLAVPRAFARDRKRDITQAEYKAVMSNYYDQMAAKQMETHNAVSVDNYVLFHTPVELLEQLIVAYHDSDFRLEHLKTEIQKFIKRKKVSWQELQFGIILR